MELQVGDAVYEFPDSMDVEQATAILREQGIIPAAPVVPVEPMAEVPTPIAPIPPAAQLAAAREEAAKEAARAEMAARQTFVPEQERPAQEAATLERERRKAQEQATRIIQPGEEEAKRVTEEGLPFFRPTRIVEQEIPAVTPEGEFLTERSIVDEGVLRPPTAEEEVQEAFALQPILGAESARRIGEKIAADQAAIDAKVAAGEEVSALEFAGPVLSGILTRPGEAAGVVETELGAALRRTLGWVSALAAEGYFRGLGYEVDEFGVPKDPDDLGLAIAQARRSIGVPDVVYPLQVPTAIGRKIVGTVAPQYEQALEDFIKAVPQLAFPTPGVATTSQERKLTTFDPEGKRRVNVVEVPSPLEDWEGFKQAEIARIAQNVAAGRTMGDEFLDAPAVRDWYAEVWGDPDAAYYAGSLQDVFMPAGPGTAIKGAKGLATLAGKAPGVAKAANAAGKAAIQAAEAVQAGKPSTRLTKTAQSAALAVANPVADIAAAVTTGRAADGRVVRRVAQSVLDSAALPETVATQAKQAIKATSDTPAQVMRDVAPFLGEDAALFGRQLMLNVPDDVVMVTANVGVPRVFEQSMRQSLGQFRRKTFQASPQAVLHRLPDAVADQLKQYERWQDVPAGLRREATTLLEDAYAIQTAPKQARLARDLTAAQTFLEGQTEGLDLLLKSRGMQTPGMRRAKAVLGGPRMLERETAAVARARQQIRAAAQTEYRRMGQRLAKAAQELGNADEAVDALLVEELAKAPSPLGANEAWAKVLGSMYGDEEKGQVLLELAIDRGLVATATGSTALFMPTVDAIRAVDQALMKANVPELAGARGTSRLTSWMAPDYQKAMLKVAVDEGTKKALAAQGRYSEQLGSAIEAATKQAGDVPAGLPRAVDAMAKAVDVEVPRLRAGDRIRKRVYDLRQSHAERVLAENGEEFAQFIESISPRARGAVQQVLGEVLDFIFATGRRNIVTNAQYGYVLPNVMGFPAALFRQAITPLLTVGLRESADITDRLIRRRLFGGGLTTNDGVYYSGKQLADLGDELGLGYSTIESQRVGSIADDMLRDARRAAEGPLEGVVKRELNPLDKSFWTRTAEATEHSMRQAAFEAQLLKGATPEDAAAYARRALWDYSEVPGVIRDQLGRLYATAAGNTKLYTELVRTMMQNPSAARVALKAKMQQARAQDPYNLHGDKSLKALGMVNAGDGVYFGPEVPLFAPAEVALGMARQGDLLYQDLRRAADAAQTTGSAVEQVVEGSEVITRALTDEALPAVWDAAEQFAQGQQYKTQGIAGATPLSDEQMLWAAALYAHHMDAGRQVGAWDWFERLFKPQEVPPPEGLQNRRLPQYWSKAPKGTPHLFWGRDEQGLPLYKVFELSEQGKKFMQWARALTPDAIERAIVAGAPALELQPGAEPVQVYTGEMTPKTAAQSAAGLLLERAPIGDAEEVRRRQVGQIAEVMGAAQ